MKAFLAILAGLSARVAFAHCAYLHSILLQSNVSLAYSDTIPDFISGGDTSAVRGTSLY